MAVCCLAFNVAIALHVLSLFGVIVMVELSSIVNRSTNVHLLVCSRRQDGLAYATAL